MAPINIQSQDHRDLLDIIDKLRSQGTSRYVPLPEIIVCGDQSSGKSSVLEAISGLSFPTKDNLCTRFATELILRRDPQRNIKVSITPHPGKTDAEKASLAAFHATLDAEHPDLAPVIELAKTAMGLTDDASSTSTRRFSNDVLRIELSGPEQQHLTLVDLPGIFRAGNSQQSAAEAPMVQALVVDYMRRPRSIILAVVSANNDFANQEITQFAQRLDPDGERTMGLITKPDKLDRGSDSERAFVALAENKDVQLTLGWHVLKNRDYQMRDAPSAARDASEAEFFAQGVWSSVNPAHLGVAALRPRLSNILKNQILAQLHVMLEEINTLLDECNRGLAKLGDSRGNEREQRQYLSRVSMAFQHLMEAAVDGAYTNMGFFGDPLDSRDYYKRLRSVVQNTLTEFAETMTQHGHTREILEDGQAPPAAADREYVYRADFINEVKSTMANQRGRELPGMFSPLVVGELFRWQCKNWPALARACADTVLDAAYKTIVAALGFTAVPDAAERILQWQINPAMDDLRQDLACKIEELIAPHQEGHPITYNHCLTDNVQEVRSRRMRADLEKAVKAFYGVGSLDIKTVFESKPADLVNMLVNAEPDMMRLASSDAIDYMEAYYKVTVKTFIDEVSVLAVERCLIQRLPTLFTPDMVLDISEEQVARLVGETAESASEREYLTQKKNILELGLVQLRRLDKHNVHKQRDLPRQDTVASPEPEPKTNGVNGVAHSPLRVYDARSLSPTPQKEAYDARSLSATPHKKDGGNNSDEEL